MERISYYKQNFLDNSILLFQKIKKRVLLSFEKFEVLYLPSTGSLRTMHLSCIMLTVQPITFIILLLYYLSVLYFKMAFLKFNLSFPAPQLSQGFN